MECQRLTSPRTAKQLADLDAHDEVADGARGLPLVVDLDGTLIRTDTLYEALAAGLVSRPWATLCTLYELRRGIGHFKEALASTVPVDAEVLPPRDDLVDYLRRAASAGRPVHLATAAARPIADAVAARFGAFVSVHATEDGDNLKGEAKARFLAGAFPQGFAYVGDSSSDLAVWRLAKAALVVERDTSLTRRLRAEGIPIEHRFADDRGTWRSWWAALRPHQWAKNILVLVPVALGLNYTTVHGVWSALLALLLLCVIASLTYCVNDIIDLPADRRHWSKRNRPFASGALAIRDGLLVAGLGIPLALAASFAVSVGVGLTLVLYVAITIGYSITFKRVPLLDTFVIGALFTLRVLLGAVAADQQPSPWLLTFAMFFFFSLAVAKRHTELLRAATEEASAIKGRGYHLEDKEVTFAFGIVSAVASVLIIVIYLVEEAFVRNAYSRPEWLWVAPMAVFLWSGRIWLLAHRGQMMDDPVLFALRDRASLALGAVTGAAFLLAVWP